MDCETNDCRKEKRGCKGCFYDKNFDNSYDYILKLNTREELIENGLKLLDELEEYQSINNCQKQSIDTLNFNIRNLQKELANKDKELETYKKIAEKLAEKKVVGCINCTVSCVSDEDIDTYIKNEIDWARKEVEND